MINNALEIGTLSEIREMIIQNLSTATKSFVAIGFYLAQVRDNKSLIENKYDSVWHFAQEEFGIDKSSASRFMDINKRFSKNGNSLELIDKFKDFSRSQLSEMLQLSDEQIQTVTPKTTVTQIRDIKKEKKKEKTVATSQISQINTNGEEWLLRCNVLKEMCDSLCKMNSYLLEKEFYSMDSIKSISVGIYGFGFGNDGYKHTKYSADCKNMNYKVEEFHSKRIWIFEAEEVNQQIWNFNAREWIMNQKEQVIDIDVIEVNDETKNYNEISSVPQNIPEDKNEVVLNNENCLECELYHSDDFGVLNCNPENEEHKCYLDDPLESKPIEETVKKIESLVKKFTGFAMDYYNKEDYSNADFYLFSARKELADNYKYERHFHPDYFNDNRLSQPKLPIMKNNDQRKDFIDSYKEWPVWIDIPQTGEKYYRYDLSYEVAIIVKVYRKHLYKGYKETSEIGFTSEQYYLLGIKLSYNQKDGPFTEDQSRTFYECSTNKSDLVEYLKYIQKKGR